MQFGSSNTAVFFKMRVAGVLHIFQFETKQVKCLLTYWNFIIVIPRLINYIVFLWSNLNSFFYQGEEICVALQTHINDVMLRRYSKARTAANGSVNGDLSNNFKPSNSEVYEKRVQELSKSIEESQKNTDQVSLNP